MTVQLAIAQLHLSHGVVYKACDALKGLGDLQYKPGVVSGMDVHIWLTCCFSSVGF